MLFSVKDLEKMTGISRYTWRAWIHQGRLPHVKLGRRVAVQERDLEVFIEANRVASRYDPRGSRPPAHRPRTREDHLGGGQL